MNVKEILEKCFTREEFLEFCTRRTESHFTDKVVDMRSKKMADYIMDPKKPFGCQTEVMLKLMSIMTGEDLTKSGRLSFNPGVVIVMTKREGGENYPVNKPVLMLTRLHGVMYDGDEAYFGNYVSSDPKNTACFKKPTKHQVTEAVDLFLGSKWKWMAPIIMDEHKVLAVPWALAEMFRDEKSQGIVIDDLDPVHPMFFRLTSRDEARSVTKY